MPTTPEAARSGETTYRATVERVPFVDGALDRPTESHTHEAPTFDEAKAWANLIIAERGFAERLDRDVDWRARVTVGTYEPEHHRYHGHVVHDATWIEDETREWLGDLAADGTVAWYGPGFD